MSGFVPPPYPFVEAWPRVFRSATGQSRWLTPTTTLCFAEAGDSDGRGVGNLNAAGGGATQPQASAFYNGQPSVTHPFELHGEFVVDADGGDESDDDGEYEYGFVLTDEWRKRLVDRSQVGNNAVHRHRGHDSGGEDVRRQQDRARRKSKPARKQQQSRQPPSNTALISGAGNSRAEHLQQELEAAKARELAMRWKHQRFAVRGAQQSSAAVRRLETALNARFDEFCDAYQPVVWPHASAR